MSVWRAVTHRHSVVAIAAAGCAVVLLAWRPWQSRADAETAASRSEQNIMRPAAASHLKSPSELPLVLDSDAPSPPPQVTSDLDPVAVQKRALLGSWFDEFYGKRTFTFHDDGTAVMTLELDTLGALLYGPKLTFFIDWTLTNDVLTMKMTGGEPQGTATSVAKLFGETSEQRIESIAPDELHLRSLDSQKLYVHKRVAAASSP